MGAVDHGDQGNIALLGVPLDVTSSFRPGSRFGPQRIRQVSECLEEYSLRQDRSLAEIRLFDAGDLVIAPGDIEQSLQRIEECVYFLAGQGIKVAILGGEHLLTYAVLKALVRLLPEVAVLHWDAHADQRRDYMGQELSHATVMHLIGKLGVPLYQMGIRSVALEELEAVRSLQDGDIRRGAFFADRIVAGLARVLPEIKGRPVYLSCDIDVVDPGYAPGTGAPEPGGVTTMEILKAIDCLKGLNLVGFDVVEVNPLFDVGDCTALLAAKIVRDLLLTCF